MTDQTTQHYQHYQRVAASYDDLWTYDPDYVRGFSRPQFDDPPSRADARAALGLPDGPLVVISGGGWGMGDLERAARAALAVGATPVCLCGGNDALRARLADTVTLYQHLTRRDELSSGDIEHVRSVKHDGLIARRMRSLACGGERQKSGEGGCGQRAVEDEHG